MMRGLAVSLLALLLTRVSCQDTWKHPTIDRQSFSPAPGFEGEVLSLPAKDLIRLNRFLSKMPLELTPLRVIRELAERVQAGEDIGELLETDVHQEDTVDSDLLGLLEDDNFVQNLLPKADAAVGDNCGELGSNCGERLPVLETEDDFPEVEDRDQTHGRLGCFADYDSYIGPLTKRWLYEVLLRANSTELTPAEQMKLGLAKAALRVSVVPLWARGLIDANAKRPTGLFQGRFHWVGTVEECVHQYISHNTTYRNLTETRLFRGHYARLDLPSTVIPALLNSTFAPFQMGVCVPDTCTEDDVRQYIMEENPILRTCLGRSRNVTDVYMGQVTDFSNDIPAKVAVGILLGGGIIILIASCYDGWGRQRMIRKKLIKYARGNEDGKDELTWDDLKNAKPLIYGHPGMKDKLEAQLAAYSIYSNLRKIFSTDYLHLHGEFHIPAVDGIRVISMMWIVYGMTYVYGVIYFECWTTHNLISAFVELSKEWSMMPVFQVFHVNDTLFFISGFVCVQMWYNAYKRNNNKVGAGLVIGYFFKRYISLMPAMMGLLMLYTCLWRYISEGPMQPRDLQDPINCRETWWLVMVFFHNIIRTDQQCMGWTWMFGAVWQLNLVSIFILVPLVLAPIAGYVLLACMYVAHIVVTSIWNQRAYDGELSWYYDVLQTPWCNAGPYCIGMLLAIIMHNTKKEDNSPKKSKKRHVAPILLCWVLATTAIGLVIYLPWAKLKPEEEGGKEWSRGWDIAWDVLSPQLMALSVAWITWASYKGYGGIVGKLLNWKAFTALGKLAHPAIVFMAPMMQSYFYGRLQPFYIHESHIGHIYHAHLIAIFVSAVFTAIGFYYPMTKGNRIQSDAKTRLEILLFADHPKILDSLTGDPKSDEHIWKALEAKEKRKQDKTDGIRSPQGGSHSAAVSFGNYVVCQESHLRDEFSEVSPMDMPPKVSLSDHKGFDNRGYEFFRESTTGLPDYAKLDPALKDEPIDMITDHDSDDMYNTEL